MDLFAQAEHDEYAQAVADFPESDYLDAVAACIAQTATHVVAARYRDGGAQNRGALIKVPDIASAVALSNRMAPEHLELALAAEAWSARSARRGDLHGGDVFRGAR